MKASKHVHAVIINTQYIHSQLGYNNNGTLYTTYLLKAITIYRN